MDLQGQPEDERAKTDLLALHLLELAIGAGWKPGECIEFARKAYQFVTSTLAEAAVEHFVKGAGISPELGYSPTQSKGSRGLASGESPSQHLVTPELRSNPEIHRRALQTLADQNQTMAEAAKILGVSQKVVASMASKLRISFHGRHGKRKVRPVPAIAKTVAKDDSRAHSEVNGLAVAKLLAPIDQRVKRRCLACNKIFEPTELNHSVCDDCESGNHAAR